MLMSISISVSFFFFAQCCFKELVQSLDRLSGGQSRVARASRIEAGDPDPANFLLQLLLDASLGLAVFACLQLLRLFAWN